MEKDWEYDIFICHKEEDAKQFVEDLANELEDRGVRPWYFERDGILPIPYHEEEINAIKKTPTFLHIVTPLSLGSQECDLEVKTAFDLQKPIFPLILGIDLNSVKKHKIGSVWVAYWRKARVLDGTKPIPDLANILVKAFNITNIEDGCEKPEKSKRDELIQNVNGISYRLQISMDKDSFPENEAVDALLQISLNIRQEPNAPVIFHPCDSIFLIDLDYINADKERNNLFSEAITKYFEKNAKENQVGFIDLNSSPEVISPLTKSKQLSQNIAKIFEKYQNIKRISQEAIDPVAAIEKALPLFSESERGQRRIKRIYFILNKSVISPRIKNVIEGLKKENIGIYFIIYGESSIPKSIMPKIRSYQESMLIPIANENDIVYIMEDLAHRDSNIVLSDSIFELDFCQGIVRDNFYRSHPNERDLGQIHDLHTTVKTGTLELGTTYDYITRLHLPENHEGRMAIGRIVIKGKDASGTEMNMVKEMYCMREAPKQIPKQIDNLLQDTFNGLQWMRFLEDPPQLVKALKSRKIIAKQRKVHQPFIDALDHYIAAYETPRELHGIGDKDTMYMYSDFMIYPYRLRRS